MTKMTAKECRRRSLAAEQRGDMRAAAYWSEREMGKRPDALAVQLVAPVREEYVMTDAGKAKVRHTSTAVRCEGQDRIDHGPYWVYGSGRKTYALSKLQRAIPRIVRGLLHPMGADRRGVITITGSVLSSGVVA